MAAPIPAVVKSVVVGCPPDAAFATFTAGMAGWWPLATHSLGKRSDARIVFDRERGRVLECLLEGTEHEWAEILEWDPPRRLVLGWRPFRAAAAQCTRLTLDFAAAMPGTRVTLTHSDWEARGEEAQSMRDQYDLGWDDVFGVRYRKACG